MKHNFGSRVSATIRNQLSTNSHHCTWHDDGTLGPLGKDRMRDDHHSDEGDKGTLDPTAPTVPACFPGDSRVSVVDLCTCSLTRTCPKWGNDLLYTWGSTAVYPDISKRCRSS